MLVILTVSKQDAINFFYIISKFGVSCQLVLLENYLRHKKVYHVLMNKIHIKKYRSISLFIYVQTDNLVHKNELAFTKRIWFPFK